MSFARFYFGLSDWRPGPAWPAAPAIVTAIAVFIAAHLVAMLMLMLMLADVGGGLAEATRSREQVVFLSPHQLRALMASQLVMQVAMVAMILLGLRLRRHASGHDLHLAQPAGGWRTYAHAFLAVLAASGAVNAAARLAGHDMNADLALYIRLIHSDAAVVMMLAVGIGAPISEELLFRGILLPALAATRLGFAGSAVATTTVWTLLHAGYSAWGLVEVFAVGLVFSWLLWRTGSLRVPLACHTLYNGLQIAALKLLTAPG